VKITVVGMATLVEANPRSAERFGREKKKKKGERRKKKKGWARKKWRKKNPGREKNSAKKKKKKKKWDETDSNQGQETPNIGVRLEITTGHMQGC